MSDPSSYRPAPGDIPESAGVYRFYDQHDRVIYVGKAKNLRSRLNSYFADPAALHPRTFTMVTTAARVAWTVVANEVEALQLEYSWIKEFDPRFNVKYRDDKSYPYLAIIMSEEYPRVQVMRGAKRKGNRYFGPYSHAWAIRETVDQLLRVFPVRTCSNGVFRRAGQVGRPCLLGYIEKCSAPCVGRVDAQQHRQLADDFADFLSGHTAKFIKSRQQQMKTAAAEQHYEQAARLRDDIKALEKALERNAVVLPDGTQADVFAIDQDDLDAAVHVFYVRDGRVRGQRGWVVEKVEDITTPELVERLLLQVYTDVESQALPREILVPELPSNLQEVTAWLSTQRGSFVHLRVPQRGDKRALAETVQRNARGALKLHKAQRAGDLTTRSQALQELVEALDLPTAPLRIECYDVSHLAGTHQVASMVVFEDGLPRKSEYRRFTIKTPGADDTAAIAEVMTRRLRHYLDDQVNHARDQLHSDALDEQLDHDAPPESLPDADATNPTTASAQTTAPPVTTASSGTPAPAEGPDAPASRRGIDPLTGKPRRFAYPPNLIVVDGGQPQVAAAAAAMAELGIDDIALCGLAKRLEEVWLPDQEFPVILPRTGQGLYLLQRIRDEAHRFAITHHRQRRSKAMVTSELDTIPGIGPAKRAALLQRFGTLKAIRQAGEQQLAEVSGITPALAATIHKTLSGQNALPDGQEALPPFDPATGEVV